MNQTPCCTNCATATNKNEWEKGNIYCGNSNCKCHTSQTPEDWRERFDKGTEALLEEVMWQIKGDMHNLAGQYHPPFTDKVERHIRNLLTETTKRVREEVAKLYCASGCSCCRDDKAWEEAGKELARLLNIPPYEDGSGFNFYKVRDEALNPNSSDETS